MKKINRKYRCLFFALPILVLVCTAAATDHNAAAKSAEPAACANIAQLPETMDQNALLHLRAANNLDCLIGIIDEAAAHAFSPCHAVSCAGGANSKPGVGGEGRGATHRPIGIAGSVACH
jgi:hypothetical protein